VGGGRWWCGVLLEVVVAVGIAFANTSGGRGGGWWCGVLLEVVVAAGIAFANARRGGGWWKVVVWCGSGGGRGNRVCERERGEGGRPSRRPCVFARPRLCMRPLVRVFVRVHPRLVRARSFVLVPATWSPQPLIVCVKYKVSKCLIIK